MGSGDDLSGICNLRNTDGSELNDNSICRLDFGSGRTLVTTIKVGDTIFMEKNNFHTINWSNSPVLNCNVNGDGQCNRQKNSPNIEGTDFNLEITFNEEGEYDYYCNEHGNMYGQNNCKPNYNY